MAQIELKNSAGEIVGTIDSAEWRAMGPDAQANFMAQFEPAQRRGPMANMLYENLIGSGEVDTPGERLGQMIRGAGAAVARGMADLPALPVNLAQLATMGV